MAGTREYQAFPMPLFAGGEDSSAAPLADSRAARLENILPAGIGVATQQPDWRFAATCKNLAGTPAEVTAVGGGWAFAQQGGASAVTAGLAVSYEANTNSLFLHQLDENAAILRTFLISASYLPTVPPQVTGLEMFAKGYGCATGREAGADRIGMFVFDPTAGGTLTIPTYVLGGGPAAPLRFRGIAKHRGGLILGWGYRNEDVGQTDSPAFVRYCKYTAPDTWVPDTEDTSAGGFVLGTLGLPVIAAAPSGQYTVLAKETEIFALDGEYGGQLYTRQIGAAHGPLSITGMASNGPMAVWLSSEGVALSESGGLVQLMGLDRNVRRLATYIDLSYACAEHDAPRTRIVWVVRRQSTIEGVPISAFWPDQGFFWDYQRDQFGVFGVPRTVFCVFSIRPGALQQTPTPPNGTPTSLSTTSIGTTGATLNWSNVGGDITAQIEVSYKRTADSDYIVAQQVAPGGVSYMLSGLTSSTSYDWRLRYIKNGQYGAYTGVQTFVTVTGVCLPPTNVRVGSTSTRCGGLITCGDGQPNTWTTNFVWSQGEFSSGAITQIARNGVNNSATAIIQDGVPASVTGYANESVFTAASAYWWVRHGLSDGVTFSAWVACAGNPIAKSA